MKKINNKRYFIISLIATAVALTCLIGWFSGEQELRYFLAFILALVYAGLNLFSAFSKKERLEELAAETDERDRFLTMKTSRTAMQILNGLLITGCLVSLVLSQVSGSEICIVIAATLCVILVALLAVMLGVNIYYEKHN